MRQKQRGGRSRKDFARNRAKREPQTRILIVTEGSKTEPSYFMKLATELGLKSVYVRHKGSAPISVVRETKRIMELDAKFKFVYCVFDHDNHPTYEPAIEHVTHLAASKMHKNRQIMAITSVPCFEFWHMLHIRESDSPYSSAAELVADLEKHDSSGTYKKGNNDQFFEYYSKNRGEAVKRAVRILKVAKETNKPEYRENPSTRVHLVVIQLEEIAKNAAE